MLFKKAKLFDNKPNFLLIQIQNNFLHIILVQNLGLTGWLTYSDF